MTFHIACVAGTRPEIIKMAPVINELKKIRNFKVSFIFTGQHQELAFNVLELFQLNPDFNLNVMKDNQNLLQLLDNLTHQFSQLYQQQHFDAVFVQGDTSSALVAALAASYQKIPIGHIEAGLRSHDLENPYPEEINRVLISRLAQWHFVPSNLAKKHLLQEYIAENKIYVTGNTIVDALITILKKSFHLDPILQSFFENQDKKIILVTTHRRESFGKPLENICLALKKLVENNKNIKIIFPIHPNPCVKKIVIESLSNISDIHLLSPLSYSDFIAFMNKADLILTDSGGIQEEASVLKKPLLILRDKTERVEIIENGFSKLIGTEFKSIIKETQKILDNFDKYRLEISRFESPYGTGNASKAITEILINFLKKTITMT